MLQTNEQIRLSEDFLRTTGANIFLTGKAGTGKTTFLRNITQSLPKRVVIAAPTGVAAINARGVTLHSLFQLPFGPCIPSNRSVITPFRMGAKKLALIRSIELLVIDEISMVRCDVLDAVDQTLRRIRRSSRPFGGVQLLMIGDIQQLSPICRDEEWQLLSPHYSSPYFFASKALMECSYITIELKHIFRQQDNTFTELLNAVRDNRVTTEVRDRLNQRYIPHFSPRDDEGYITLTTHNSKANTINHAALKKLKGRSTLFKATIKGDYPESAYPNDSSLELRVGAQVIFIKNDISPNKLYYNGLIGRVTDITDEQVTVQPNNGEAQITISAVAWDNIEYTIGSGGEIEESIKGSYSQIPLKCAWAITIHKSQGLTFDRAIIDAGNSFAHGQVYVALSRCRSFEGMVLKTPISLSSIIRDNTVEAFSLQITENEVDSSDLEHHRRDYYYTLLSEIFNFAPFNEAISSLSKVVNTSLYGNSPSLSDALRSYTKDVCDNLLKVGDNFCIQLKRAIDNSRDYTDDQYIDERLSKAAEYFGRYIDTATTLAEQAATLKSGAADVTKRLKKAVADTKEECAIKRAGLDLCATKFSCEKYLKCKFDILTDGVLSPKKKKEKEPKPKSTPKESETEKRVIDVVNEQLYEALVAWRLDKSRDIEKPAFTIFNNRTLLEIQADMPTTIDELREISGVGEAKLKQYGDEVIEIIREYRLGE